MWLAGGAAACEIRTASRTIATYVIKDKDGRRNRYQIQAHLPLPDPPGWERTVGEVVVLLAGEDQLGTGLSPAD